MLVAHSGPAALHQHAQVSNAHTVVRPAPYLIISFTACRPLWHSVVRAVTQLLTPNAPVVVAVLINTLLSIFS